jgi:hypothetical protein
LENNEVTHYYPNAWLPAPTMRALHSRFIDWLVAEGLESHWRNALLCRVGGASFSLLIFSLHERRMVVTHRTDTDGHLHLGLGVPAQSGPVVLFDMPESQHGISADEFVALEAHDLDSELAAMLGGQS